VRLVRVVALAALQVLLVVLVVALEPLDVGIALEGQDVGGDAVEYATLDWVEWFNNQRLLTPIGDVPPAGLEAMYHQKQQAETEMDGVN
jgi:hypothetical protein